MQVEVDQKCMQTNIGGHDPYHFRDFAPFQIWPNFRFWTIDKNRTGSENLCK